MKIQRLFTQAGQPAAETVEYEIRRSVLRNPDGSVLNEIDDVEAPAGFSQVAADILAQKYFRRAGVPDIDPATGGQRLDENGEPATRGERSIKEVVHRMAGCWRHWGEKGGYFDTAEDAEAFYEELSAMLLQQRAAPNSPQWFNTGLAWAYGIKGLPQGHWRVDPETEELVESKDSYTNSQVHACFIQSISDDLVNDGGIMDLWTREARVFKFGSGTGTNFSSIRGEGEPLSGGGRSSGLMSFLKIGDRAAGAIKSGGTTRRAAKMVCLDMDHPDIEEFVNWKSNEEKKARALIAAGYDSDFNGEVYQTVSGQNSNNSVRTPHEFLEAVERGGKWRTTRRVDGKIAREYDAADLWNQVARAAWECADPGVQYDTTINDWHTCPTDGRINASNPCVTGDALVATAKGWRRIDSLLDKRTEVVNGFGQRVWIKGAFKTGRKPVFELKTRSGYRLRLTGDHKVLTANRGDVPASELTAKDEILLEKPGFGNEAIPAELAEVIGAAVGDGCLTRGSATQEQLFITFGAEEEALAERLRSDVAECKRLLAQGDARSTRPTNVITTQTGLRVGTSVATIVERVREYAVLDEGSQNKAFTERIFDLDGKSQAAILRMLFATDGTISPWSSGSQYISLESTSLKLLLQTQLLLMSFGIKAKIYENRRSQKYLKTAMPDGRGGLKEYSVKQLHSLRITCSSRVLFEKAIGFPDESAKAERLSELNKRMGTRPDFMRDKVKSLEPAGEEDVYDLTEPISHHFVANGIVVHNCSEYLFLDDTACNLASINLLKFYNPETREFDIEGFEHACRLWTVVLEISVLMAQFPSQEIARKSYEFRTLGLGYANLGAMLMTAGIPYDSPEGRAWAGAITSILTGVAYKTSAEMASQLGAFPGWERNRGHMLRVMRNHRRAAYDAPASEYEGLRVIPMGIDADLAPPRLLERARLAWDEALALGERHGYRNAQATVIAPTGTIGLVMDCVAGDTRVITELGEYTIAELCDYAVTSGVQALKVLTVDPATGETSWEALDLAWIKPSERELVEIETEDGRTLRYTPDHRVLTTNGFKAAKDLTEADELVDAEGAMSLQDEKKTNDFS